MTMSNMDNYLRDRGFSVVRIYIPERSEYKFTITKSGMTKSYFWSYECSDSKQIESLDNMILAFNNDFTQNMRLSRYVKGDLYGSIDTGYVYNPKEDEFVTSKKAYSLFVRGEFPMTIPTLAPGCLKKIIKNVIFNEPATIVFWNDGSKTVVKAHNEEFDREKGLAMAITKKFFGNEGNYYNHIKKWLE